MEYIILENTNTSDLQNSVNTYLENGYILYGNLIVSRVYNTNLGDILEMYYHIVVKM